MFLILMTEASSANVDEYLHESDVFREIREFRWLYFNGHTGVHFHISKSVAQMGNLAPDLTPGYLVKLEFLRPSFFHDEIVTVLEKLCLDCRLEISDGVKPPSQDAGGVTEVLERYRELLTTDKLLEEMPHLRSSLPYIEKSKSDASWLHNFNRQKLLDKYSGRFWVPIIKYNIPDMDSTRICTGFTWADLESTMIPQVDFIVLGRMDGQQVPEQIAIITFESFVQRFGEYLTPIDEPGYLVVNEDDSKRLSKQGFSDTEIFTSDFGIRETVNDCKFTNVPELGLITKGQPNHPVELQ